MWVKSCLHEVLERVYKYQIAFKTMLYDMEDKGMETVRAQRFQQTLISRLSQYPEDSFQVIYTTSCITPQLDQSALVVGEHYRAGHKSLRNV